MNFSLRLALVRADLSMRQLALATNIERTKLSRALSGSLTLTDDEKLRVVDCLDYDPWAPSAAPQGRSEAQA